ncbi:unnamed protein product [Caenorhabditis auriculariae]|uniref:Angiomotin C-terminal domain-containing protein n=1 Tax=Caenorhabditis auriculariae TaxID=2777116 RepID=A0A8S1GPF8_9PELO|nr:unnamed protein product [Caenorhabditis auriculariae]
MNRVEVNERSSDTERRIHAVPPTPMYQGETKLLDSLWKEAHLSTEAFPPDIKAHPMVPNPPTAPTLQQPTLVANLSAPNLPQPSQSNEDDERKLQQMLEKYQHEVKQQQQKRATTKVKSDRPERTAPISHSQPCLIAIGTRGSDQRPHGERAMSSSTYQRRASASGEQPPEPPTFGQTNQRMPNNQKLVQSLREENMHLKKEMEGVKRYLFKLQQIEFSYAQIEKEYEVLLREKEKQENLEVTAIMQLEKHVKRLTAEKEDLQIRLDKTMAEPSMVANIMIAEMQQKQELLACKERQKLEIDAQNQTLEEQRNHIAMLEKALANSQERLAKKDKKCEDLCSVVDRAEDLRRQLEDVLAEQLKRDEAHSAERAQWEMEKTQLRMQLNRDPSLTGSLKRTSGQSNNEEALLRMRKSLHVKDERITQLEKTIVDLQKTLLEETERRKCTLNAITESFEVRIKRLEEEKVEKDKKISELKLDKDKLTAILERNHEDDAAMRDLHKMEDIRQRIQERRKKGRLGVTGGLMGSSSDHARSPSASILQSSHLRSSSGPFDPIMPSSGQSIGYSHSFYKPS